MVELNFGTMLKIGLVTLGTVELFLASYWCKGSPILHEVGKKVLANRFPTLTLIKKQ